MGILSWIMFGLIVGIVAKFVMPGSDPGGIIVTIVLGVVGAFLGGFVATQFGYGGISGFDIRSGLIAIGGALLVLVGYRMLVRNRAY